VERSLEVNDALTRGMYRKAAEIGHDPPAPEPLGYHTSSAAAAIKIGDDVALLLTPNLLSSGQGCERSPKQHVSHDQRHLSEILLQSRE
jgi:hypothetical protein